MTTMERGRETGVAEAAARWPDDAGARLAHECGFKGARIAQLLDALETILSYAEDREDADCVGDPPRFVGNTWMQIAEICREALR